jgi:hypothetical protein
MAGTSGLATVKPFLTSPQSKKKQTRKVLISLTVANLIQRFHESCHMRGVISEFKIRSGDWMGTVDPAVEFQRKP